MPEAKFAEFRRRSIENYFKEILFSDGQVPQGSLGSQEFAARIAALEDPTRNEEFLRQTAYRINYGLTGFGRVPKEFASLMANRSLSLGNRRRTKQPEILGGLAHGFQPCFGGL